MTTSTNKRVNMSDVARAANVSRPTVSMVLAGRYSTAHIAEETRERVLQAASDLGYRRNALAQAIKTGRSLTLGFLSLGVWTEYETLWLLGALDEAEAQGYTMKRFRLHNSSEDRGIIEQCIGQQLDGIIVADDSRSWATDIVNSEFAAYDVPLVWLDPQKPVRSGVRISMDHEGGSLAAVHHLAQLGHRSIAFIGGVQGVGTSVPRLAGFERGIQQLGDVASHVRWADWGAAHLDLGELLAGQNPPTAIVCATDIIALGLVRKLSDFGMKVPEDMSIVGFGDLPHMEMMPHALTTCRVPYSNMGKVAVNRLLELAQFPDSSRLDEEIVFPAPLIVRETTSAPTSCV